MNKTLHADGFGGFVMDWYHDRGLALLVLHGQSTGSCACSWGSITQADGVLICNHFT